MKSEKKNEITVRSGAAEYLTFVAATGDSPESVEMRYEDENIWLTQKMMATLYDVEVHTVNEHIKKVFADSELSERATIRNFRIVQTEGAHAETEFEKYRIVQDRLFESDFDRFIKLEKAAKIAGGKKCKKTGGEGV